jgi:hypothetical protein
VTDSGPQHAAHAVPTESLAPAPVVDRPADDISVDAASDHSFDRGTAPEPTGHDAVDEVTASLAELDGLPVDEHVGVFESAHDRLRAVLASGGESTASTV